MVSCRAWFVVAVSVLHGMWKAVCYSASNCFWLDGQCSFLLYFAFFTQQQHLVGSNANTLHCSERDTCLLWHAQQCWLPVLRLAGATLHSYSCVTKVLHLGQTTAVTAVVACYGQTIQNILLLI